jgi:hypothetical protein
MNREDHYTECMQFVIFCNLENRLEESSVAPSLLREYALGHPEVGDPDSFVTDIRAWRRRQIGTNSPQVFYSKKTAILAALLDKYREAGTLWEKLASHEAAAQLPDDAVTAMVTKVEDEMISTVLWLLDEQSGVEALSGA